MTKINAGLDAKTALQQSSLPDEKSLKKRRVDTPEDINKAASGFEALLLHNMLQEMWKTTGSEGILGEDSNESQIFRDMFHQSVADEIAEGDGIGVKQFLKNELSKYGASASNKGTGVK